MIELRAISEDNFRECLLLRASVENEDFVDPVTYSLAEAWVYYQDTRPFAIYSDDTIVGFVSMYVGEDNYQIINFLIDDAFQRKGYGSKAVKLCIEYLQREFSACRISAPVKMEHIAAQEFWIKQGFCLSDTIEDMEIGWILKRNVWGKGYARILTKMLITECRKLRKGAIIECDPRQAVTEHIAKKHGFKFSGKRDGCDVYKLEE